MPILRLARTAALSTALSAFAALPGHAGGLADMLAILPATVPVTDGAMVDYLDLTAFDFTDAADLRRASAGQSPLIEALRYAGFDIAAVEAAAGLPWSAFTAIVTYGEPPGRGFLYGVEPEALAASEVAERLTDSGFQLEQRAAGPVYWLLEDGRMDFAAHDPENPFIGGLPISSRVLLLDDAIANVRFWAMVDTLDAVATGALPNFAARADVAALAEALEAQGQVTQALITATQEDPPNPLSSIVGAADPLAAARQAQGMLAALVTPPPYSLMAIAEVAAEPRPLAVIALTYRNADQADEAAAVLDEMFATHTRLSDGAPMSQPMTEGWSVGVVEAGGLHVAMLTAPSPLVEDRAYPLFGYLRQLLIVNDLPVIWTHP
ncbi:MAG: hypothetical protein KDA64_19175 [Rhodospirillaceae bacterium]|nr:hypothetical protein [Rhodospirillaceae bacterium]